MKVLFTDPHYFFVDQNLTAGSADNKSAAIDAGSVMPLVDILRTYADRSDTADLLEHASGVLQNLAAVADFQPIIVSAGGIPALLTVLGKHSSRPEVALVASSSIAHLCSHAKVSHCLYDSIGS